MKHIDTATRAVVVARLREKRDSGASINADVRRTAAALLVADSTVWRWLATDDDPAPRQSRARYELTDADRDDYLDWRGNVAALRRVRIAAGGRDVPPLRTLQRAFARQLSPAERAAAVDGVEGRRRHEVYLRWEPVARNARWEADHKELPVLVTPPRGTRPCKPWVTLFVDCYSRLIMGWALSLRPDSATVLAALRRGLVIDPERGPFGGVPRVLVPDNGLEFATTALERVCGVLGTTLDPTEAYAPHQKGKVERANRTVDQEFLSGLPFYTEGPRAADGRLYGPDAPPMALGLFVDRFAEWVIDYNTVRAHSALGGLTPLQRWIADPTPGSCRRSSCGGCCSPMSSAPSTATASTSVATRSSPRSSTGWSGRRSRSATPRTTCAGSRSSATTPGCAPRIRRARCRTRNAPRCSPADGRMPRSWGGGSVGQAAEPGRSWRRSPNPARWRRPPWSA